MSQLRREAGKVVIERPGTKPTELRGLYYGLLLTTALCGGLTSVLPPPAGALILIFVATVAMVTGLLYESRHAYGGRLLRVKRTLELVEGEDSPGYREAARGSELVFAGHRVPKSSVREVVRGHIVQRNRHGESHAWPVYLVTEDRVIELAVVDDEPTALKLGREVAELLGVPVRDRETHAFGAYSGVGCFALTATILLQTGLIVGAMMASFEPRWWFASLLLAFAMWLINWGQGQLSGSRIREVVDDEVTRVFELAGAKVRVAPQGLERLKDLPRFEEE